MALRQKFPQQFRFKTHLFLNTFTKLCFWNISSLVWEVSAIWFIRSWLLSSSVIHLVRLGTAIWEHSFSLFVVDKLLRWPCLLLLPRPVWCSRAFAPCSAKSLTTSPPWVFTDSLTFFPWSTSWPTSVAACNALLPTTLAPCLNRGIAYLARLLKIPPISYPLCVRAARTWYPATFPSC